MAMTKRQWEALAMLLAEASDAIVAVSEEGEEDQDAGTLMSACEVAEKYARRS